MNIDYQFTSTKISQGEKNYIEKKINKINKLLTRNKSEEKKASVEISQDKHSFWKVSITLNIPRKTFRAKKTDNDLLVAVDQTEKALTEQIRRSKERVKDLVRKRKRKA